MKGFKICMLSLLLTTLASCGSPPAAENVSLQTASLETASPQPEPPVMGYEPEPQPEPKEVVFDPNSISHEYYETTKVEVQRFIEDLNRTIRGKNYNSWKSALSEEFFATISSPEYLRRINATDGMRTRNIVLRTPEDYFIHVVVPSRANSRVDDIEFVSRNKVKAYTVTVNREGQPQRLRLYDLEKIENMWKIVS